MVEKRDPLLLIDHVNTLDRRLEFVQSQVDVTKSGKRNMNIVYVTDKQNQHLAGHQI